MPDINEVIKDIKKTKNLEDILEGGIVRKDSFTKVIGAITDTFRKYAERIDNAISSVKSEMSSLVWDVRRMKRDIVILYRHTEKLSGRTRREIRRVERLVAKIPDYSYLEKEIESVRKEIPDIPEIPEIPEFPKIPDPETPEEIRNKLEELDGDDRLDIQSIKGLDEKLEPIRALAGKSVGGGGMHRSLITDIDISSLLDGSTKTFNIQAVYSIVSVSLSSYPYGTLRKGVDYTHTDTTITFTDTISAATQLSSGQQCILTVVSA